MDISLYLYICRYTPYCYCLVCKLLCRYYCVLRRDGVYNNVYSHTCIIMSLYNTHCEKILTWFYIRPLSTARRTRVSLRANARVARDRDDRKFHARIRRQRESEKQTGEGDVY